MGYSDSSLYNAAPKNLHFSPDALNALAYATPFLLMDLGTVDQHYKAFAKALPGVGIHYAMKANPHPRLLAHLHRRGCTFEVASYPELAQLMAVGVDPAKVLFSNPVKIPAHIQAAHNAGLHRFAFSSRGELQKIAAAAPGAKVYVRLAVTSVKSEVPSEGKFGVDEKTAVELMLQAGSVGLRPYGIAFHVGSQMSQTIAWQHAIRQCAAVLRSLESHGIRLHMLDVGGGYPAFHAPGLPSIQDFGDTIMHAITHELPYIPPEIVTEPGRGLVSDAGVMVATVLDVIARNGDNWVYTDLGGFTMMEALQTGHTLQYPLTDSRQSKKHMPSILAAGSCDSMDVIMHDRTGQLSADLQIGDRVYIGTAGAYTTAYASDFNGLARPTIEYVRL